MSDKPILFSAPMVRALLAGTKTQTRRVVKPGNLMVSGSRATILNPRIRVGDRLYVRETWSHTGTGVWTIGDTHRSLDGKVVYEADGRLPGAKYWPSIHMPRAFSRITITVTDVRVQRLHQIDGADARAEGTPCYVCGNPLDGKSEADCHCFHRTADASDYANLWNAINGTKEQPDPWSLNPWVAAYTFTVERCNIDQARAAA